MKFNKAIQILSLFLLLYLLADAIAYIDFAATKNHGLIMKEKMDIDSMQNMDSVKQKAWTYLDRIERKRRDDSSRSVINVWLVCVLIFFQGMLLYRNRVENNVKNN